MWFSQYQFLADSWQIHQSLIFNRNPRFLNSMCALACGHTCGHKLMSVCYEGIRPTVGAKIETAQECARVPSSAAIIYP